MYQIVTSDLFERSKEALKGGKGGDKKIDEDVGKVEEMLKEVAFKKASNINKLLKTINLRGGNKIDIWYCRVRNSSKKKPTRIGYRVFYYKKGTEKVLLLAIAQKGDQKNYNFWEKEIRNTMRSCKQ